MWIKLFPIISPIIFGLVVIILGFITPGYNHINYTISRLAVEKYGIVQSLNFLQLALGISLLGSSLSFTLKQSVSKATVRTIFLLCAMFLTVAAFTPTDPIENIPFRFVIYTPMGLIHAGAIMIFLAASPIGIHRLSAILDSEPEYKQFGSITRNIGYTVFFASVAWLLFFVLAIGLQYRGIFQKIIAIPVLYWLTIMSYQAQKSRLIVAAGA